jgi:hypothetical protein
MTRLVQMKLLTVVILVAMKVNLAIGIIGDVVHSTQLQSLVTIINSASISETVKGIVQCVNATMNAP